MNTERMINELRHAASNLDRDPLLVERERTHGDFTRTAMLSQQFKRMFRQELQGLTSLDPRQAEALDMIAVKLARILSGDVMARDHWDDLAGYSKLGSEACERK